MNARTKTATIMIIVEIPIKTCFQVIFLVVVSILLFKFFFIFSMFSNLN